jgi:hypothetical protein
LVDRFSLVQDSGGEDGDRLHVGEERLTVRPATYLAAPEHPRNPVGVLFGQLLVLTDLPGDPVAEGSGPPGLGIERIDR